MKMQKNLNDAKLNEIEKKKMQKFFKDAKTFQENKKRCNKCLLPKSNPLNSKL